jgi:hypothetical protein
MQLRVGIARADDLATADDEVPDCRDKGEAMHGGGVRVDPEVGEPGDVPRTPHRCDLLGARGVVVEAATSRDARDEDAVGAGRPDLVVRELGGLGQFYQAAGVEAPGAAVLAGRAGEAGGKDCLSLALVEPVGLPQERQGLSGRGIVECRHVGDARRLIVLVGRLLRLPVENDSPA